MLARLWRLVWPALEPWLAQMIWLDPAVAAACWTPELAPWTQQRIQPAASGAEAVARLELTLV